MIGGNVSQSDSSADITDISALPSTFASAASTGSRSPRSITAAAVTGSLINSHSDSAATGASVTDADADGAEHTRPEAALGRLPGAVGGRFEWYAMMILTRSLAIASTVPVWPVLVTR